MKKQSVLTYVVVASTLATLTFVPTLPDRIPVHWNLYGEVDRFGSKWEFVAMALLPLVIMLLMRWFPKVDPRRDSYELHQKAYAVVQAGIVVFLCLMSWVVIYAARGGQPNVSLVVGLSFSVLMIVMGNYMTQIRQNYFFGIRTPWTLASESVWRKTHRVGGALFMGSGLITAASIMLSPAAGFTTMIVTLLGTTVAVFVYSYVVFKREQQ